MIEALLYLKVHIFCLVVIRVEITVWFAEYVSPAIDMMISLHIFFELNPCLYQVVLFLELNECL